MEKRTKANITSHAVGRMVPERISQDVSKHDILQAIKSGQFVFAKKLTHTRSIIYGEVSSKEPFKAVYSRKEDLVITILPMYHTWKTDWFYFLYRRNVYRLMLFPDCYIESENSRILTKFEIWIPNGECFISTAKRDDGTFWALFETIWDAHKKEWYGAQIKKTGSIRKI